MQYHFSQLIIFSLDFLNYCTVYLATCTRKEARETNLLWKPDKEHYTLVCKTQQLIFDS